MFTFKPKKVFEKLNKMDRKQAYTIWAIVLVSIVALLMLFSALAGSQEDSFDGMTARGYDLATMPFATDGAEQYLLANAYPDMQGNGSTLLYSAVEKQARQEEDAQAAEEDGLESGADSQYDDNTSASRSDNGGYQGNYRGGGQGGGKTEVGQLGNANMVTSGGSGINSTFGPTGDYHQFKGKEDKGKETPAQLQTGNNARRELAQFRRNTAAAARIKDNRLANAFKTLMGGTVDGKGAINEDGSVDLSKAAEGGLTLDTEAPPSSSDLGNIEKKLDDAQKENKNKNDPKKEDDTPWWQKMLQGIAEQALQSLVGAVMDGVGDSIRGAMANNNARNRAGKDAAGLLTWDNLSKEEQDKFGSKEKFDRASNGDRYRKLKTTNMQIKQARADASEKVVQYGQNDSGIPTGKVRDSQGNVCDANRLKDGHCP